jgi:hypothetical protein
VWTSGSRRRTRVSPHWPLNERGSSTKAWY